MKMKSLILGTILMLAATVAAQDECTRYKAIGGNAYAEKNYEKVTYAYVKALQECEVLEMKFLNPFIYSIK
jgi:hypothetical protein